MVVTIPEFIMCVDGKNQRNDKNAWQSYAMVCLVLYEAIYLVTTAVRWSKHHGASITLIRIFFVVRVLFIF